MEDTENVKGSFEEAKESQILRARIKASLMWLFKRIIEIFLQRILFWILAAVATLVIGVSVPLYKSWTTASVALVEDTEEKDFAVVEKPFKELKRAVTGEQRISIHALRANAEHGLKRSQYQFGLLYFTGSHRLVEQDMEQAVVWWNKSATQGYAAAQNALGFAYWNGEGVEEEDREKAVAWYKLALKQDFSLAQYNLGVAYWKGEGVKQSYPEAMKLWRLAAKQGLPEAQYDLAEALWKGKGVEKDPKDAERWYERAADKGHLQASFKLGKILKDKKKTKKAVVKFKQVAEQGLGEAQYEMGVAYEKGVGIAQEDRNAYYWFSLAAIAGHGDASQKRDDLKQSLAQTTIGAADNDVNALQQKIDEEREDKAREQQKRFIVTNQ